MPQCGLHMNNVSFLKQWGKKYGIGIIVGLFIVILTLKSPFDISFAILVIAFLTSKKMFEKELMK